MSTPPVLASTSPSCSAFTLIFDKAFSSYHSSTTDHSHELCVSLSADHDKYPSLLCFFKCSCQMQSMNDINPCKCHTTKCNWIHVTTRSLLCTWLWPDARTHFEARCLLTSEVDAFGFCQTLPYMQGLRVVFLWFPKCALCLVWLILGW